MYAKRRTSIGRRAGWIAIGSIRRRIGSTRPFVIACRGPILGLDEIRGWGTHPSKSSALVNIHQPEHLWFGEICRLSGPDCGKMRMAEVTHRTENDIVNRAGIVASPIDLHARPTRRSCTRGRASWAIRQDPSIVVQLIDIPCHCTG